MQLKNDMESFSILYNSITDFYSSRKRDFFIFESKYPDVEDSESGYYIRFLVDKENVLHYRIFMDRNSIICEIALAIGPHYFDPGKFWSYENSIRFTMEASVEGVIHNLKMMDEFFREKNRFKK